MSYSIPLNGQYKLSPPSYNNDDPLWRGAGDPRPEVQGSDLPDGQIVVEEGTPYSIRLNAKEIRSNGKQESDSVTEGDVNPTQPYLSILIPPTAKSSTRTYPSGNPAWPQGSMVLKDKAMITLPEPIDISASNNNTDPNRWFQSFEFNLDNDCEVPNNWMLIWQAWQQSVKHNPPISMNLSTGYKADPLKLHFTIADDKSQNQYHEDLASSAPVVRPGSKLLVQTGDIQRDVWHKVIFQMRPHYNGATQGSGRIKIWLDGQEVVNFSGDWGYKPTSVADQYGASAGAKIVTGIGIYRGLQPRIHHIAFRNVKWSKEFTEV